METGLEPATSPNMPATTFTLFPELPSELRLKIWRYVAPGPRIVGIELKGNLNKVHEEARKMAFSYSGWRSSDPIPVVLQICHESRAEALKSYRLAFGSWSNSPTTYFDFETDTLCFGRGAPAEHMSDPRSCYSGPSDYLLDLFLGGGYHGGDDAEKVQRMIVDITKLLFGRKSFLWDEIRFFTGLKELTIVSWEVEVVVDEEMSYFRESLVTVFKAHPEWVVPDITVVSAITGKEWGRLEIPTTE